MDYKNIKYSALICCAGNSSRYGGNKLLEVVNKKFIFEHSIAAFLNDERCDQIIILISEKWHSGVMLDLMKKGKVSWMNGGSTRTESTRKGLEGVRNEYVFIHDGCRPLTTKNLIDDLLTLLLDNKKTHMGAVPFFEINDLVIDKNSKVVEGPLSIMTPQFYLTKNLKDIFNKTKVEDSFRDTSTLCTNYDGKVKYLLSTELNTKLTTKNDLSIIKDELIKRENKTYK